MKKIILSAIAISLLITSNSTSAYAQASAIAVLQQSLGDFPFSTTARLNEIKPGGMITKDAVNDKIQNAFKKFFMDAKDDQWFFINKKVFGVCFDNNGRYSRAAFTKGGGMIYSVMQASEKLLPKEDRKAIKSNYVDYDITNVAEVTSYGRTVWIVNLQDADHVVVVRVENSAVDELAKYVNAGKK